MTRSIAKSTPAPGKQPSVETILVGGGQIRANGAAQKVEAIAPSPLAEPRRGVGAATLANPVEQAVEDIQPASPASRPDGPRLSTGARIVENLGSRRSEKIARKTLTVSAGDEMAHKKLFTRFEEAFLTADIAALRACLSPAFQWHLPNGEVVYGREEALAEMGRRFAMPNRPKFSGTVWLFKDSTVIQTYDVEFLGPDGLWRQSRGMDFYDIGGGLITRKDAYWKMVP